MIDYILFIEDSDEIKESLLLKDKDIIFYDDNHNLTCYMQDIDKCRVFTNTVPIRIEYSNV